MSPARHRSMNSLRLYGVTRVRSAGRLKPPVSSNVAGDVKSPISSLRARLFERATRAADCNGHHRVVKKTPASVPARLLWQPGSLLTEIHGFADRPRDRGALN